jgi:hypothetical protein
VTISQSRPVRLERALCTVVLWHIGLYPLDDENKIKVLEALRSLEPTSLLSYVITLVDATPPDYGPAYVYVEGISTSDYRTRLRAARRAICDAICYSISALDRSEAETFLRQYVTNLGLKFTKAKMLLSHLRYQSWQTRTPSEPNCGKHAQHGAVGHTFVLSACKQNWPDVITKQASL